MNHLSNQSIPLALRVALSDAALELAAAELNWRLELEEPMASGDDSTAAATQEAREKFSAALDAMVAAVKAAA